MWWKLVAVVACVALCGALTEAGVVESYPFLEMPQLKDVKNSAERIAEHGYPSESHFVETPDNYVLNVFRIPYSPKLNNANAVKPVVFIQHGLFSCSDCFLVAGPDDALPYNFADAGYDVWLGNARGNIYSRNNTRMSLNHPYFWRFSWHEIGNIDIPAMIDYILEQTGQTQLHYVGHSQGTTVFFVMTSTRPEYNAKIKTAHMLAPAVFMGNTTDGLVVSLAPYIGAPGVGASIMTDIEFIPFNQPIQRVLDTACSGSMLLPTFCRTLFLMWAGSDIPNMNTTLLPQLAETHPAGISSNQGIHYIQSYRTNEFRYFDYGTKLNLKMHGVEEPPYYDLSNIVAPMYIYYGLADTSADHRDVRRLPEHLSNLKLFHEVPIETFGHLDFIFAWRVKELINDLVIGACNEYEEENAK